MTCVRYKLQDVEPYFRLTVNLLVFTICVYLYSKCAVVLSSSRNTRKRLLTKTFAALLVCWFLTVIPHVTFYDFVLKEESTDFAEFIYRPRICLIMFRVNPEKKGHIVFDKFRILL